MKTVNTESFQLPMFEAALLTGLITGDDVSDFVPEDTERSRRFLTDNKVLGLLDVEDAGGGDMLCTFLLDESSPLCTEYICVLFGEQILEQYRDYGLLCRTSKSCGDRLLVRGFANSQHKEEYLSGLRDGTAGRPYKVVDNLTQKLAIWWQAQPEHVRKSFSVSPSYEEFWSNLDMVTRLNIYNWCLLRENMLDIGEDRERSLLIEIVFELSDIAMEYLNGKPRDTLCKDGEYCEEYQDQYNRLYDSIKQVVKCCDFTEQ